MEGKSGKFVNPLDPEGIAFALDEMVSDPVTTLFEKTITHEVMTRFSWEEEFKILEWCLQTMSMSCVIMINMMLVLGL